MRMVSKRGIRQVIAILLVLTMLAGMPGLTVFGTKASAAGSNSTPLRLWYDEPASQTPRNSTDQTACSGEDNMTWQQSTLPIGNGDMGANIYGEIGTERLTLNEKTLWAGGPSESRPNYMGGNLNAGYGDNGATIRQIQEYFLAGNSTAASNLSKQKLIGVDDRAYESHGYGYFAPWGELKITTSGVSSANSGTYQRWLELDNALAGVEFTSGSTRYTREYFMSHPDNVLAAKLTASNAASFTITLMAKQSNASVTAVSNDTLCLSGSLPNNQMKYASFLKVVPVNGSVSASGSSLTVAGTTEVALFFSAATDYKNDYPVYRTGESDGEVAARVKAVVDAAAAKGYTRVREDHLTDYHGLYDRMSLDLGQAATSKTTDILLGDYNNNRATVTERRLLEVMLFQYGRYLTIASSREDSQLPSNLQGVWNNRNSPPWASDYHLNVNLQMNYWPTYVTNLAECADPLVRYVDSLREPGRVTAKVYAGIESTPENPENGFMVHTQNTPFGWTCPGWDFEWGWAPGSGPWIIQNCWEHYEYTGDLEYMRKNIYPMMKEAARLYDQLMIDINPDPNVVELATVPAYSPEHGPITMGNTYEQTLVWQLYTDAITAAELLGDTQYLDTWKYNLAHLKGPIQIGDFGQIKEWYDEVEGETSKSPSGSTLGQGNGHRHLSHMLGLFSGDLVQTREEWIEAARVSMNARVDRTTGWGMGHRINVWARLRDSEHAYNLIKYLFASGIYNNLWDTHTPFQIDGNFGYTSGVAEMLMQSNMGFIDVLPALPSAWPSGSARGMVARGNFELDFSWEDGALETLDITARKGGECVVYYPGLENTRLTDDNGNLIAFDVVGDGKISFQSAKGQTYHIAQISQSGEPTVEVVGLRAGRTGDNTVEVAWKAVAGESYQVYRQAADGEWLPLGDITTSGKFVDESAYSIFGDLKYAVGVNGAVPGAAVVTVDVRNMPEMVDNIDHRIQYTGGWANWESNEGNYNNSVEYINSPAGGETATLTFYGTGIEVMTCTNPDRGYYEIFVDGESQGKVSTYSSNQVRQKIVFSKTNLDPGVHVIKLLVANEKENVSSSTKVELDAFKVLGGGTSTAPSSITVSSGGVTRLTKVGATLQMTASDPNVTWSVSGTDATISATGLLTAGSTAGTVTVTATSTVDSSVSGTAQITVSTSASTTTEVTATVNGTSTLNNSQITYTGEWQTWNETNSGVHSVYKAETYAQGNSYAHTFTVPEGKTATVEIYSQVWRSGAATPGTVGMYLDNVKKGTASLIGGSDISYVNGSKGNIKVYTFSDIPAGNHTVKGVAESSGSINLDYIKVILNDIPIDRSALVALIQECAALKAENYTSASWSGLQSALAAARNVVNADSATQTQVTSQINALTAAKNSLVGVELSDPANIRVVLAEGTAVTLAWDAVVGAENYDVVVNGQTFTSSEPICRITGLSAGQRYTFTITAKNAGGKTSSAIYHASTKDTEPPTKVNGLVWNAQSKTLTWAASEDNVGVIGYRVSVDGGAVQMVTGTSVTLSDVDTATQHVAHVTAVDEAGNASQTTSCILATSYTLTVHNAVVTGGRDAFTAGEAVTLTAEIPHGQMLTGWNATGGLSLGETTDNPLSFAMPAGDVTVTAVIQEKNWNVEFQLGANLTVSPKPSAVAHGDALAFTLNAAAPYSRPDSLTVTMGGKELTATKYSYNTANGRVTIPEVIGDVVIKAEAAQKPSSNSFSASDRFVLPSAIGSSSKAEAEYMAVTGATKSNGPGFNNQHLGSFTSGNKVQLYFTAPVAGIYTATFHYRSARVENNLHTLGWSGENVETRSQGSIPNTLNATGNASYESRELRFIVPQEGAGRVDFTIGNVGNDSFDLDWVSFRLDAATGAQVTGVTLDPTTATIYTNAGDPAHSIQLNATVEPAAVSGVTLNWSSSNRNVAQVQQNGTVTPVAPGTATITVAVSGSNVSASATVTVKTKLTGSISISGEPRFDNELSVNLNQLEPQGSQGTLQYQWKQNGNNISGVTTSTFTVREEDIEEEITVSVTGTGYYEGTVTAPAVTGAKAAGPRMVAEPTHQNVSASGANDGAITGLYKGIKYQYQKLDKGTDEPEPDAWIDFSDMTATETPGEGTGTAVIPNLGEGNYVVRRAETETHEAGPISKTVTIVVEGAPTHGLTNRHDFEGGTVQTGRTQIPENDTVNLRVKAADGYELVEGSLKAVGTDGTEYPAQKGTEPDNANGVHYTFEMPAQDVTIEVKFQKLQVRIGHQLEHISCNLEHTEGEEVHVVDWGAVTEITLTPDKGYDLPETVTIQGKNGGEFKDYSFGDGKIVFTRPVTQDLTIIAEGIWQSYQVTYVIPGLTAIDQPRKVDRHGKLEVQLSANPNYQLPEKADVEVTIAGVPYTDFTYESGKITIAEGVIEGIVHIHAEGVNIAPELIAVSIGGQTVQGQEMIAQVTPEEAGLTARYQWFWVEGEIETPIEGATNPRYTLSNDDVGKTIKVRVTAVAPYSGEKDSLPVGAVAEAGVVLVTSVELDKTEETILAGGGTTLTATVYPANATNKAVRWASGNTAVATVDAHGLVTGEQAGTATIVVTTVNGSKSASCIINVVNILLDQTSATVRPGGKVTLNAMVSSNLSSREVTWTSDNEQVATVDENGVVTGILSGTAVITATTLDGEFVAFCTIKVGSSGGGSVGGGSASGPQSTTIKQTNPDGSVVTTVKSADGSVTIIVKSADGEELVKIELPGKPSAPESEFVDVPKGHWAEEAIDRVAALGLVKGVGDNRYDMYASMTRGSLATVLYRLSQGKADYKVTFYDVANGRYYTEGVAWAAKAGVVKGITDEIFAPENTITREQLAVMMARYAKLVGLDIQADAEVLEEFVDSLDTGDWAVDGVAWCVKTGILQGKGNDTLDPTAEVTRAEVAVMLDRFIALLR